MSEELSEFEMLWFGVLARFTEKGKVHIMDEENFLLCGVSYDVLDGEGESAMLELLEDRDICSSCARVVRSMKAPRIGHYAYGPEHNPTEIIEVFEGR